MPEKLNAARYRVDLNTATRRELESLPMIDPEIAAALIAARPFRNWEDLVRVKGFYIALVEDLRDAGAEIA